MQEKVTIDEEFQGLIPPLNPEEFAQLEENLIREGCRDPLVVWPVPPPPPGSHKCYDENCFDISDTPVDELHCNLEAGDGVWTCSYCRHSPARMELVLLDGHNRLEICQKHGIEYNVEELDFPDRDAAKDWMEKNQLGRRNLTPEQASILRGSRYMRMKKNQGGDRRSEEFSSGKSYHLKNTSEVLAKEHGVSEKTIRNDAKKAEAFYKLREESPDLAKAIMAGETTLRDVQRATSRQEKTEQIVSKAASLPEKVYQVIYADPP